jgi:hypothetical protein
VSDGRRLLLRTLGVVLAFAGAAALVLAYVLLAYGFGECDCGAVSGEALELYLLAAPLLGAGGVALAGTALSDAAVHGRRSPAAAVVAAAVALAFAGVYVLILAFVTPI